jgi:hypothetical protein
MRVPAKPQAQDCDRAPPPRAPIAPKSVLRSVVRDHLEEFLQAARDRDPQGRGIPRRVERAFRGFLDCGDLRKGFARVRCPACEYEALVGFS